MKIVFVDRLGVYKVECDCGSQLWQSYDEGPYCAECSKLIDKDVIRQKEYVNGLLEM